jgi:hypothetical protein
MSTTKLFERIAPVFEGSKIVIAIDSENPLSTQLTMITGDGWNSIDWSDTLKTGEITHKKSGLVVKVLPSERPLAKALDALLTCTVDAMLAEGFELTEEQQSARMNALEAIRQAAQ